MPVAMPPLVGRADEIAHLHGLLRSAAAGVGCITVITGEPGVGKTRLVEAAGTAAAAAGMQVRIGRGVDREVERALGVALDALSMRLEHYVFRHDLYRAAVLSTVTRPARSLLHLHAARSLARAGAPVLDVAEHYAQGARPGDREAVRWLRDAALDIVAATPAGALRLVDVALELAGPAPPDDLVLVRVRALAGTGRTAEADLLGRSLLRDGLEAATEASLRRELGFTALMRGHAAECVTEIERCAELTAAPGAQARVYGELAFARFMVLDHAGARAAAEHAVWGGQCHGDLAAQVAGDAVLCFLDLYGNRVTDAVRRARDIVDRAELPRTADAHVFQPWFIACLVHLETDRLDLLSTTARRGREVAVERGAGWAVPGYDAVAAFGALRAGAFDDAAATAGAALGYLDGVDGLGVAVWCHAFLAQVLLNQDDVDAAEAHVATAEGWLTRERAQLGFEQVQLTRAGVHERRGRPDAALAALRLVWDAFRAIGVLSPLPAIGAPLARLAHGAGHHDLLTEVAGTLADAAAASGMVSVRGVADLAAAWRDSDPDLALSAAVLLRHTPRPALVATALTDAAALLRKWGRLVEADRVTADTVERWSALGACDDADACAARSRTTLRTTLRAKRRPRFGVGALTTTERRVTALVADGLLTPRSPPRWEYRAGPSNPTCPRPTESSTSPPASP